MSEALEILVVVAGCAIYAVMLIVPVVEHAAMWRRIEKVVGGWQVSERGRQFYYHTTCHAPDMDLYRENLKSRRRGNGF